MSFDITETYNNKDGKEIQIKMTFADSWQAIKYDAKEKGAYNSTYHFRTIQNVQRKAVDVVAVRPQNVMVLIEIKEVSSLDSLKITQKYYDTIAGMVCAWISGENELAAVCKSVFNNAKPKIQAVLLVVNSTASSNTKVAQSRVAMTHIENGMGRKIERKLAPLGINFRVRYLSSPSSEFGWEARRI